MAQLTYQPHSLMWLLLPLLRISWQTVLAQKDAIPDVLLQISFLAAVLCQARLVLQLQEGSAAAPCRAHLKSSLCLEM